MNTQCGTMRTVPRLTLTLTPTLTPTVTLTVNLSSVATMNTGALGWAGPHAPQHPRSSYWPILRCHPGTIALTLVLLLY